MVYDSGWNFMLGKMNIHRTIRGRVELNDTRRGIDDNAMILHPIHSKYDIYPLTWKDNESERKIFPTQVKGNISNYLASI